jgi:iron complex transport system ATP-binding protein
MASWRTTLAELSLSSLTVGRKDVLVNSVSMELAAGQIFVLLGPNGSGKSTLLQTICGMIRPFDGIVAIDGKDVAQMPLATRCRKIAWVPQEEFVEFGWTAREFAALGRAALSDSVFESKDDLKATATALEMCDASHLADRPLHQLSGGEKQRIRIARAIAQDADVLVLDEPASQLDVAHVLSVLELVVHLAKAGKTIIMTVHDVNQALRLPARWGFINEKRLEVFESLEMIHSSGVLERTYQTGFRVIDAETVVAVSCSCRTTGSS